MAESVSRIPAEQWDILAPGNPFLSHAFLLALEASGCATARTGWAPRFLTLWDGNRLVAGMPLYLKYHSYGEYVFDWAWADAYRRQGLRYYPKLVCAVPFTPVTGPRALAATPELRISLILAAQALARELDVSSLHCLFPEDGEIAQYAEHGMLLRSSVQFHWRNPGYESFDRFLQELSHDKRKKIRQERRKLAEAGITFERIPGPAITGGHWQFFNECYQNTYERHRSTPYLNLNFFLRLGSALPEHLLLVLALRDGRPIGSALNVQAQGRLYGRYWGAQEYWPGMHFETCYYQAIEHCIEQRLEVFEGGAQGEHKLARGFLPVRTRSAHWIADPRLAYAIDRFLKREDEGMGCYIDELGEHSPFRHTPLELR